MLILLSFRMMSRLLLLLDTLFNPSNANPPLMPLIWETIIALAAFIAVYYIKDELNWPMITLGAVAAVFALVGLVAFHRDIWAELKKRFHTK